MQHERYERLVREALASPRYTTESDPAPKEVLSALQEAWRRGDEDTFCQVVDAWRRPPEEERELLEAMGCRHMALVTSAWTFGKANGRTRWALRPKSSRGGDFYTFYVVSRTIYAPLAHRLWDNYGGLLEACEKARLRDGLWKIADALRAVHGKDAVAARYRAAEMAPGYHTLERLKAWRAWGQGLLEDKNKFLSAPVSQ